jgi:Rrf2 family protein
MSYFGASVEYAIHCLLWLAGPATELASARDLADLQGVSSSFLAKIFPKLERGGIVEATTGIAGGYRLARPAAQITVLDVVDAVEEKEPLFDCQEIRARCALFSGKPPAWATGGTCGIHSVMLRAEAAMRAELARTTIASLGAAVAKKAPTDFQDEVSDWLAERVVARRDARPVIAGRRSGGGRSRIKGR